MDGEFLRRRGLGGRRREKEGRKAVSELGNRGGEGQEARRKNVSGEVEAVAEAVEVAFERRGLLTA